MRPDALHARLRTALKGCDLPTELTWYQCTPHTFASQWVMANGSLEKLAAELGHSSTEVTRHYAHCGPISSTRLTGASSLSTSHEGGEVVPLAKAGALGPQMTHGGKLETEIVAINALKT